MRPVRTVLTAGAAVAALSACSVETDSGAASPQPASTGEAATSAHGGDHGTVTHGDSATTTGPASGSGITLRGPDGDEVGTVELTAEGEGTTVSASLSGLPPGFHGFHVHATGQCEPDSAAPDDAQNTGDFLSAGGHLNGAGHGMHIGDLPSLYVADSGEATLTFFTDRFTPDDLRDDDGSAFMVHAGMDNYAHIPERYAPEGPDDATLRTGDAGERIACGVVE